MKDTNASMRTAPKRLESDYPSLGINDFGRGLIRSINKDKSGTIKAPGMGGFMLDYEVNPDNLSLEFFCPTQPIDGLIYLTHSESTFGRRPWFVCPGCGTSRGKLYRAGRAFKCRKCLDLAYESTRLPKAWPIFRLFSRQMRIIKLSEQVKRISYAGQLTRRAKRIIELSRAFQAIPPLNPT